MTGLFPLGVSLVLSILTLGMLGTGTALAQIPIPIPTGSPSPAPAPIITPLPLPVPPPQIVAEAGVLPGGFLGALDRLAEVLDRTVFSFGFPTLRARIALAQAAERIAELQALERNGQLTPAAARALLAAQGRLVEIASDVVARQVAGGRAPTDLVLLLARTRLAAAEILRELEEELAVEAELLKAPTPGLSPEGVEVADETLASPPTEEVDEGKSELADLLQELDEAVESLVDVEDDILPQGAPAPAPDAVLRLLAGQKIAKAERDLLRANNSVEERLVHGKVLIADVELRAVAESLLVTARELFAAGNFREALSVAKAARAAARRLASGKIVVEPNAFLAEGGERHASEILEDLVEEGLIDELERATAEIRARQVVEQVRRESGASVLR